MPASEATASASPTDGKSDDVEATIVITPEDTPLPGAPMNPPKAAHDQTIRVTDPAGLSAQLADEVTKGPTTSPPNDTVTPAKPGQGSDVGMATEESAEAVAEAKTELTKKPVGDSTTPTVADPPVEKTPVPVVPATPPPEQVDETEELPKPAAKQVDETDELPKPAAKQVDKTDELPTPAAKPSSVPTSKPPTLGLPEPGASANNPKERSKGKRIGVLLAPILLIAAFYGAWALDVNIRGDRVARNTEINGVDISGLSGDELSETITKATDDVLDVDLTVTANGDSIVTTPRALGAEPDIEATATEALKARQSGFILVRPFSWASSFLRTDQVEATYSVDQEAANEASQTIFEPIIEPVIETSVKVDGSSLAVVPGAMGERIEASEIEDELPGALEDSASAALDLTPVEGAPQISEADAEAAADEASDVLDEPLPVQLINQTTMVEPSDLLKLVVLDNADGDVTWVIDNDLAVDELKKEFADVGSDGDEASFTIVNEKPVVVPIASAVECCDETTGQRIKEGAKDRPDKGEFVILEPEYVGEDPTADKLNSYGITEEVSSFTTPHDAGGPRVTNIQRFADLMRGTVIEVGDELSLNEAVGERTREKGFVADSAINQGVLEPQVGGGISQFATTYFNAAFFAGIDIQEHQFHTLKIGNRYPLGRESTISWGGPDVRVKNTSEHPILIWTSYTDTSITVTFYSQKHLTITDVNGDELGFDVYRQGRDSTFPPSITSDQQCSVYTTRRFTEFPDGNVVEDSFSGFYRPGAGLNCDGTLTPKAQEELDAENAENNDE